MLLDFHLAQRASALLALTVLLSGCIASNVVAREDRARSAPAVALEFAPGPPERLAGMWESVEVRGEAAAHLAKIYYLFEPGGRYTAAALVLGAGRATFQTLEGTWLVEEGRLVLDGSDPVELSHAPDHVRIEAPTGSVLLRSVELE